jgi:hypothetical protein
VKKSINFTSNVTVRMSFVPFLEASQHGRQRTFVGISNFFLSRWYKSLGYLINVLLLIILQSSSLFESVPDYRLSRPWLSLDLLSLQANAATVIWNRLWFLTFTSFKCIMLIRHMKILGYSQHSVEFKITEGTCSIISIQMSRNRDT